MDLVQSAEPLTVKESTANMFCEGMPLPPPFVGLFVPVSSTMSDAGHCRRTINTIRDIHSTFDQTCAYHNSAHAHFESDDDDDDDDELCGEVWRYVYAKFALANLSRREIVKKYDCWLQHLLLVFSRKFDVLARAVTEAAHRHDVSPLQRFRIRISTPMTRAMPDTIDEPYLVAENFNFLERLYHVPDDLDSSVDNDSASSWPWCCRKCGLVSQIRHTGRTGAAQHNDTSIRISASNAKSHGCCKLLINPFDTASNNKTDFSLLMQ